MSRVKTAPWGTPDVGEKNQKKNRGPKHTEFNQ